mgnify:CR=1 FL=1
MNEIIEFESKRVLTTALLAEEYGTDEKHIHDNFSNNSSKYVEGKHYFCLQGETLKQFKEANHLEGIVNKNAPVLYLWTEKGALLHAKSLNTDRAWQTYENLVDGYFNLAMLPMQDSYMIADPVKRAERWIAEYQEKKMLEQTVEVQKIQIAEQDEVIVEQKETIAEQDKALTEKTERIAVQEEKIQEMTPKADYYDKILSSPELMTVTQIAADYGKGAKWLNDILSQYGIQRKSNGMWVLYSQYAKEGYAVPKVAPPANNKRKSSPVLQLFWTHKGRMFIYETLKEHDILPLIEKNSKKSS